MLLKKVLDWATKYLLGFAKSLPNRKLPVGPIAVGSSLVVLMMSTYFWLDSLSWFFSAIGRLFLIKLLPFWDWPQLYNAKCLIAKPLPPETSKPPMRLDQFETVADNCALCINLDHIPALSNVTFSFLESKYLERGFPVIIEDAMEPKSLEDLLYEFYYTAEDFLKSEPCDLSTNLMLKKFFSIEVALEKIRFMDSKASWFFQIRNCRFSAIKASRAFINRPYFYPLHFEPFFSSWLIMMQNYQGTPKEIYLQGLIIIQQMSGSTEYYLRPKRPCEEECPNMTIDLQGGESLIFSTDLWILSYSSKIKPEETDTSVATIVEIDWNI